MKLTVKRSLGKLDHLNVRLPTPLKRRLESLRKRAEELNIDYTATLVATLDDFATELEAKMNSEGISEESRRNLTNGGLPDRA